MTHKAQTTLSTTILCHYAECHDAEYRALFIIKMNVIMLNVVMQSVVAAIMPSVVALFEIDRQSQNKWADLRYKLVNTFF